MITPIPNKTAKGLVEYCKQMVGLPYWCGCYGQTASAELLKRKKAQYPSRYTAKDFETQFGKKVHDCCGLIKGYMWTSEPYHSNQPKYNVDQDCNVQSFYDRSTVRGTMKTFPARNGIIVYNSTKGHMGVFSDNYVYEAKGHAYGVVKSAFSTDRWYYWSECPYISYTNEDIVRFSDFPTIKFGSQGIPVKVCQAILGGTTDGDFGPKTDMRVRVFQKEHGLSNDGIVGPITWKALIEYMITV